MFTWLFGKSNNNKQLSIEEQIKLCENNLNLLKKKQSDENEKNTLDLKELAMRNTMRNKTNCLKLFNEHVALVSQYTAENFLENFSDLNDEKIIVCSLTGGYISHYWNDTFDQGRSVEDLRNKCKFTDDDIIDGVKRKFIEITNINPSHIKYIPKSNASCSKLVYTNKNPEKA